MKSLTKLILLIIIFSLNTSKLYCQELNKNAKFIKERYTNSYESNIKKYALLEWKEDYSMVLYEINKQSDAMAFIIENYKTENTQILFKAIITWSREGKEISNGKKLSQLMSIYWTDLLALECDWSMVKYEYEKQVKAKMTF